MNDQTRTAVARMDAALADAMAAAGDMGLNTPTERGAAVVGRALKMAIERHDADPAKLGRLVEALVADEAP